MTRDLTCGRSWTGKRMEHCKVCHETFSGTISGDRHRTGRHGVDRRCLTPEEMRDKGMEVNARGIWTSGGTSPWADSSDAAREVADAAAAETLDRIAQQDPGGPDAA